MTALVESLVGYVGPIGVGALLLSSGALAAIDPAPRARQVESYGILPRSAARWATAASILAEVALGTALIAGCVPRVTIVAAVALLTTFAVITWLAGRAGRIEDCGCYHGLVELTPGQGAALNAVWIAVLVAALPFHSGFGSWIAAATVITATVGTAVVLWVSARRLRAGRAPWFELVAVRAGRRWNPKWLPTAPVDLTRGEHLVAFLAPSCRSCKAWLADLHRVHTARGGPAVLGVIDAAPEQAERFAADHGITFPLVRVRGARFRRLVRTTPIAARLTDGRITARFGGR